MKVGGHLGTASDAAELTLGRAGLLTRLAGGPGPSAPRSPLRPGPHSGVVLKMLAPSPSRSPRRPFPESFLVVPVVIGAVLSAVILYLVTTGLWLFVQQVLQQQ
jgi:hypothetical protein